MVKAKVAFFVYSEGIQPGPPPTINAPIMLIAPASIPGNYSFAISFGVQGVDVKKSNKLQVVFCDPNDNPVQDTGVIELPANAQQENAAGEELQGFVLNMDFRNMLLEMSGEYSTKIMFNNEIIEQKYITVIAGKR